MQWFTALIEAIKLGKESYKFARALQAEGEAAKGRDIVEAMRRKYLAASMDEALPRSPSGGVGGA